MSLLQLHLILVSAWFGVIAAEAVVESYGRDAASRRLIAVIHGWIDVLFELPIVIVVLITGGILLVQAWPAPTLLLFKVALGLTGIIANLICIPLVRMRMHETDDKRVKQLSRKIQLTGLAIPIGIAAFILGIYL